MNHQMVKIISMFGKDHGQALRFCKLIWITTLNQRQKDSLWKQRTHYRLENGSLGFTEDTFPHGAHFGVAIRAQLFKASLA